MPALILLFLFIKCMYKLKFCSLHELKIQMLKKSLKYYLKMIVATAKVVKKYRFRSYGCYITNIHIYSLKSSKICDHIQTES